MELLVEVTTIAAGIGVGVLAARLVLEGILAFAFGRRP